MIRNKQRWTMAGMSILVTVALSACQQAQVADSYSERAKTYVVKANMKKVQAAAEAYFKDHTYMYPTKIDDDFKSYFDGGDPAAKKPGKGPNNPFTGNEEWPVLGGLTDPVAARQEVPMELGKGVIEYSAVDGGKNYAIRGGAENRKSITGENESNMGSYVISRDSVDKPSQ